MAITMRRGDVTKFLPSKLLSGEWAVVLDNDPTTGERADGIAALRRGFVDDIRRLHDNP